MKQRRSKPIISKNELKENERPGRWFGKAEANNNDDRHFKRLLCVRYTASFYKFQGWLNY